MADAPPLRIDHLAILSPDLEQGTAWAQERLGLSFGPVGKHPHFGTHNRLLRLGDIYLEVISPNPKAAPERPRWFGLDHIDRGTPRLGHWICATPDLPAALRRWPCAGDPVDLTRGAYRWRMSVRADGSLPLGGAFPSILQWQTAPPLADLRDCGARLARLEIRHPEAYALSQDLAAKSIDSRLRFIPAPEPSLCAQIEHSGAIITL